MTTDRSKVKSQVGTQSPKEPPNDQWAEESLIGALLVSPHYIPRARAVIRSSDFYNQRCRLIFGAIERLTDKHTVVDLVTIADELTQHDELRSVGGRTFLSEVGGEIYTGENYQQYIDIVLAKSKLRKVIEIANRTEIEAYGHKNPIELVSNTVFELKDLGRDHRVIVQNTSDFAEMAVKPPRGVVTGFEEIDDRIVCLDYGSLVTVCGSTGMGKTSFSTDIHRNNFNLGVEGILIDGEMTIEQRIHRIAAAETRIPLASIRQGNLNVAQQTLCEQAVARMGLRFIYMPRLELNAVVGIISTYSGEGIKLFTIDNVQKIKDSSRRHDTRTQELSVITSELKEAAGKYDCLVVIISHMARVKDRKPVLSDLRDSGTIEQDSDTVILVHRTDAVETSIDFLKGRQIGKSEFKLQFYPTLTTFKPSGMTQGSFEYE